MVGGWDVYPNLLVPHLHRAFDSFMKGSWQGGSLNAPTTFNSGTRPPLPVLHLYISSFGLLYIKVNHNHERNAVEPLRLHKKGDKVRQVLLVNERRVRSPFVMEVLQDYIPKGSDVFLLCSWIDTNGNCHERTFPSDELELV
jgi:hypothetical protein